MLRVEPDIIANYVANGSVRLAFRPMLDHSASLTAHHAAECAGAQSPIAFWDMHNVLFEYQVELWNANAPTFVGFAQDLDLDTAAFESCLNDQNIAGKLVALDNQRRSERIRLRPTFDLNGEIIQGALPFTVFAQRFDEILSQ